MGWEDVFAPHSEARDVRCMKEEPIEIEGRVHTVLPGTMFRVELPNNHQVLCNISGRLRKNFVRLGVGDKVKVELSPDDLTRGRITYREK